MIEQSKIHHRRTKRSSSPWRLGPRPRRSRAIQIHHDRKPSADPSGHGEREAALAVVACSMASHPSWHDIYDSVRSRTCKRGRAHDHLVDANATCSLQNAASPDPSSSRSTAPGWHANDADVTDFGPSRLDDDVEVVVCRDCGKVVLRDALSFHQGTLALFRTTFFFRALQTYFDWTWTENCHLIREIAEGRLSPSIIEGDVSSLRKRGISERE